MTVSALAKKTCAIGIILNDINQVLISRRPPNKEGGLLWEFPGGKVEPSETVPEALMRELEEELGIQILDPQKLLEFTAYHYHDPILLEVFLIRQFYGQPYGKENQPILWVDRKNLNEYPFLEANSIIIDAIQSIVPTV